MDPGRERGPVRGGEEGGQVRALHQAEGDQGGAQPLAAGLRGEQWEKGKGNVFSHQSFISILLSHQNHSLVHVDIASTVIKYQT